MENQKQTLVSKVKLLIYLPLLLLFIVVGIYGGAKGFTNVLLASEDAPPAAEPAAEPAPAPEPAPEPEPAPAPEPAPESAPAAAPEATPSTDSSPETTETTETNLPTIEIDYDLLDEATQNPNPEAQPQAVPTYIPQMVQPIQPQPATTPTPPTCSNYNLKNPDSIAVTADLEDVKTKEIVQIKTPSLIVKADHDYSFSKPATFQIQEPEVSLNILINSGIADKIDQNEIDCIKQNAESNTYNKVIKVKDVPPPIIPEEPELEAEPTPEPDTTPTEEIPTEESIENIPEEEAIDTVEENIEDLPDEELSEEPPEELPTDQEATEDTTEDASTEETTPEEPPTEQPPAEEPPAEQPPAEPSVEPPVEPDPTPTTEVEQPEPAETGSFQNDSDLTQDSATTDSPFEKITVELYDPASTKLQLDNETEPIVKVNNDQFEIALPSPGRRFKPGKYTLKIEFETEEYIYLLQQDFNWGVLSINSNKSIFSQTDQQTYLQMGVLDDQGHTICDADLTLEITSPSAQTTLLTTADGTIHYSGLCQGDTVVNRPDYYANYALPGETGEYQLKLTANTQNGTHQISDFISVEPSPAFDIERIGPSRIWPQAAYKMKLKIKANSNYSGTLIEAVPNYFQVTPSTEFTVSTLDKKNILEWPVNMTEGQIYTFSYEFDAPDISPEFYLLGPAQIGDFQESRYWQIANDDIWYGQCWEYRQKITIDNTKVSGTSDLTDFPVLINSTSNGWKDTSNGGKVRQSDGGDILFTSSDKLSKLDHEIEYYDPATGELITWVELSTLDYNDDTDLYMYYGCNNGTDQWDKEGTWNSSYLLVQHLEELSGIIFDSTSNNADMSNNGASIGASGEINGAVEFDGSGDYLEDSDGENYLNGLSAFTLTFWLDSDLTNTDKGFIHSKTPTGDDDVFGIRYDASGWAGGGTNLIKAGITVSGNNIQYESSNNTQSTSPQHLALTWQSGGQLNLYIDGQLDTPTYSDTAQSGAISGATTLIFGIGAKDSTGSNGFDGILDEVKLTNDVKTAGWIQTEYNNQNSPSTFYSVDLEQTVSLDQAHYRWRNDDGPELSTGGTDIAIYREATATDTITTANFDHDFDTTVREDAGSFSKSGSDITLKSAGHYLVLYSSRFDSTGSNYRSEIQSELRLDGVDLPIGWSQGYMRRSNGADELFTSGGGIIETSSANETLNLRSFRTDANAAGVQREPNASGLQLIKLDDDWDYLRLSKTGTQTGPTNTSWVDITYDRQEEYDTSSFFHLPGSANIQLNTAGHYLVLANTYGAMNTGSTDRTLLNQKLTLDGTDIEGTYTTVYTRGNNNGNSAYEGAASIGSIIETTSSNQVLNVEMNRSDGSVAWTINTTEGGAYVNRTGITIVKLPDDADYIRLNDTGTDNLNTSALTPLGWDTELEEDSASFTHPATAQPDSTIEVNQDGDYLFMTSNYTENTGITRAVFNQGWTKNGAGLLPYGQTGKYIRSSGSRDAGNWSGIIFDDLQAGDYIEVETQQIANSGTLPNDNKAVQGVSIDSLFPPGPGASFAVAEDTKLSSLPKNTTKRLRFEISNEGNADITGGQYRLEVSGPDPASCSSATYTRVNSSTHWNITDSAFITDAEATQNITPGLTDENSVFIAGQLKDLGDQTTGISLIPSNFTEIEYALQATASATDGADYCFRLTNAGVESGFNYSAYAEVQVVSTNNQPQATSTLIDAGAASINLTESTTTSVTCVATVTDNDGFADIQSIKAELHRSGVAAGSPDDNNNHYTLQGDTECIPSGGSGNNEDYTCTFQVEYYADPTDAGDYSAENWECLITPSDTVGAGTTDSDNIEMNSLSGISTIAEIDYGTLGLDSDTGTSNIPVTLQNTGNINIDLELSGTELTCTIGTIPASNQRFDSSNIDYLTLTNILTTTPTEYDLDYPQRQNDLSPTDHTLYWGLAIPATGVSDTCTGSNTFTAVNDIAND